MEWIGATPLHLAASYGHIDMCKLLVSEGADVSANDHATGRTVLQEMVSSAAVMKHRLNQESFEIVRILIEGGADEELLGDTTIFESNYGPEDVFTYIQQHTFWKEPSFPEKCIVVTRMLERHSIWEQAPQLIGSFIGGPGFSSCVMLHRTDGAIIEVFQNLCERLAAVKRCFALKRNFWGDPPFSRLYKSWENLVREMIASEIPLHNISPQGTTPLQGIQKIYLADFGMRHWERQLLDWLEILQSANVDLEQYGKKEMSLFKRHRSDSCAPLFFETPVTRVPRQGVAMQVRIDPCHWISLRSSP
ncbi:hypothetical protein EAF04_007958 [Stromatinia cepivora]|nr:hypothetical protein EAF04_007958 [Stromatinia cepivora]